MTQPRPEPDPGNSQPEIWESDLTEQEQDEAFEAVNSVAVSLPEPEDFEQ